MALLTKVKTRVTLHARRKVAGLLDGQYAATQSGRSLDFADLRAYVPGDDVADIDWLATARHGDLLVRRYVAERRHTVLLVVDTGRELSALASWEDGDGDLKRDVAVTVAGLVGWVAISHGDYVGLVCSTEDGPAVQRPTTRELPLERMLELVVRSSATDSPPQRTLDLLDYAAGVVRRRTIMVLVLGDVACDHELEARLARLLAQHELLVVTLADVDPTRPGRSGRRVRDVGTGRGFPDFAARSAALAAEVAVADRARAEQRAAVLTRLGVPHVHVEREDRAVTELLTLMDRTRRAR
ncbi:DUF58 domain-containing protein [Nocardioides sp. dk4132]|uniref:DUF58 domain-containing protein n=1 Tax=unclassified Nocardioides TaxID=2615069 RepID=UPI001295723A|nr:MULTISPECIES: DUF58 domain-containing protein [unclassified Nocardioides]MQW77202.1 DUF58 domain-containing protein [Nocardioides sp. dk4132]QGA07967.1 DUF58 domain-containing protein [Nocardioides sp. dk884]